MPHRLAVAGLVFMLTAVGCLAAGLATSQAVPSASSPVLPRFDHILVVLEENKDFEDIVDNPAAPYLNRLAAEGAVLTRMYGEEHNSEGNYFWLFSGSNQDVGFNDDVPAGQFNAPNLGAALIAKGLSFAGFAESLPAIGSQDAGAPPGCGRDCVYARKHVPWISFANLPNGATAATSVNLRFADFPGDYARLPTVGFVIPDQFHDMHSGPLDQRVPAGDRWLAEHLDRYVQWAKNHNSLLVVTFDENRNRTGYTGLTDPAFAAGDEVTRRVMQNRIPTIIAGAHLKPGCRDPQPFTHVNLLRTIEAIYGLPRSGAQQPYAARAGIADDAVMTGVFEPAGR